MCTRPELALQMPHWPNHLSSTWESRLLSKHLRVLLLLRGKWQHCHVWQVLWLEFSFVREIGSPLWEFCRLKSSFLQKDKRRKEKWGRLGLPKPNEALAVCHCILFSYFFIFLNVCLMQSTVIQEWFLFGSITQCTWNHISCFLLFLGIFQCQYWPVKSSCSCQYVECNAILVSDFFHCWF